MIDQVLIMQNRITKKRRVIFYHGKSPDYARRYDEPTAASCSRLEKMIRELNTRIYLRDHSVSIWIRR